MSRHYSAKILARYQEGDVSRRKAMRIKVHLQTCSRCPAVAAQLTQVTTVLASVEFAPMPAHLADRLTAALAAESVARMPAAREAAAAEPAHIPGRPDLPERAKPARRWRMPELTSPILLRGLAATGALTILAGGGYLLANNGGSTGSESAPSASHAGAPAGRTASGSTGVSTVPVTFGAGNKKMSMDAVVSDTNYQPSTLGAQIRRQLPPSFTAAAPGRAAPTNLNGQPNTSPTAGAYGVLHAAAQLDAEVPHLASCLTKITAAAQLALVDIARFKGKPAIIIAIKIASSPKLLNVFVVGRACSASALDIITKTTIPLG